MGQILKRSAIVALGIAAASASGPLCYAQNSAREAIEAANQRFVAAYAKQDTAGLAAAYSADAEAFPPNEDVLKGRAAIEKMWKGVMDSGITSLSFVTQEVESQGTLAYEVGTYEMKTNDDRVADRGKYCVVWKQVNGQWMVHRDIWNSNMPIGK